MGSSGGTSTSAAQAAINVATLHNLSSAVSSSSNMSSGLTNNTAGGLNSGLNTSGGINHNSLSLAQNTNSGGTNSLINGNHLNIATASLASSHTHGVGMGVGVGGSSGFGSIGGLGVGVGSSNLNPLVVGNRLMNSGLTTILK